MIPMNEIGQKNDSGKPRWSLMPFRELSEVLAVLEHGALEYGANNWKNVTPMRDRYFNAAMRHLLAWWGGDRDDPDSGRSHLAHAICCLIFLMWGDTTSPPPDK